MKAMLVSGGGAPFTRLYWEDESGKLRRLRRTPSGKFDQECRDYPDLKTAIKDIRRGLTAVVEIEVPDIRVAIQYLGREPDVLDPA